MAMVVDAWVSVCGVPTIALCISMTTRWSHMSSWQQRPLGRREELQPRPLRAYALGVRIAIVIYDALAYNAKQRGSKEKYSDKKTGRIFRYHDPGCWAD